MKTATRLRELIREIGMPLRLLPDIFELKPEECLKWWSDSNSSLSISDRPFLRIAELVGINEDQLVTGNYERELARKRLLGEFKTLPERYQQNQNSFLRTSAHIVRYMTLTRGQNFTNNVLHSLNVSPLIYQDFDNQKINLTYFVDLLETLAHKGFTQGELDTLASVIFLSLAGSDLGNTFAQAKDAHDIYTTLAKSFEYFDSNFEYKSEFIGKKYILKTTLNLEEHQLFKESPEKIRRLMRYRQILIAWFPYLAGLAPVFPKTELKRFNDVLELHYELDLTSTEPQTNLIVV